MANEIKKEIVSVDGHCLNDEDGIEQPTKDQIQRLCEQLNLPFNKETAMALIYGDNEMLPERILPSWLGKLL